MDHFHPVHHITEHRKAQLQVRVARGGIGIEPGLVLDHDREIARRGARLVACHRQRPVGMTEPGFGGRFMRDRVAHAVGVHLRTALQQAVGRFAPIEMHRAVELRPVEPVLVDIAQEIARGDRRAFGLQRNCDVAHGRLDHDALRGVFARGRGGRIVLRGQRTGQDSERGEQSKEPGHRSRVICRWSRSKRVSATLIHGAGLQS